MFFLWIGILKCISVCFCSARTEQNRNNYRAIASMCCLVNKESYGWTTPFKDQEYKMCTHSDVRVLCLHTFCEYVVNGHRMETAKTGVAVIHITFMTLQDTILYTLSDSSSSLINCRSIKLVWKTPQYILFKHDFRMMFPGNFQDKISIFQDTYSTGIHVKKNIVLYNLPMPSNEWVTSKVRWLR